MCFPSRNNQQYAACASQSLNGPADEIRACPRSREEKAVVGGGKNNSHRSNNSVSNTTQGRERERVGEGERERESGGGRGEATDWCAVFVLELLFHLSGSRNKNIHASG